MIEEEGLPNNPDLEVADMKFKYVQEGSDKTSLKSQLLIKIEKSEMAPYYEGLCKEFDWKVDELLLKKMKDKNAAQIVVLDAKIADTETNLGESDIRDANFAKAEYLCKIGAKEECLTLFRRLLDMSLALGQKLDVVLYSIRVGLFYMDVDVIERNIDKAKTMIDEGGDWDRRNRLKVYEGVYHMYNRNFTAAVELFLDAVSTFTSTELMSYDAFVRYTVCMAMVTLPRTQVKAKVMDNDEIQQRLNSSLPDLNQFLVSLYNSDYSTFFLNLMAVEAWLKGDR
jgi:26S proteasome regulatory subunit N7